MVAAVEVARFEHHGAELAYEVHGGGDRVLVYLHGLLMDRGMNRSLAHALAERGNRVVLLDLLGHGESDAPVRASAYRMDAYGDEVLALLDHLEVGEAVIGGVSLGAGVTLQVAVDDPERVRAAVLEMPVLEWAVPAAALVFTRGSWPCTTPPDPPACWPAWPPGCRAPATAPWTAWCAWRPPRPRS